MFVLGNSATMCGLDLAAAGIYIPMYLYTCETSVSWTCIHDSEILTAVHARLDFEYISLHTVIGCNNITYLKYLSVSLDKRKYFYFIRCMLAHTVFV